MRNIPLKLAVTVLVCLPFWASADETTKPDGAYVLPLFNDDGSKPQKHQSRPTTPTFPEENMGDNCEHTPLSS